MPPEPVGLLQGSLNILILKTLSWKPLHGFGIARWIRQVSGEALDLEEGTLYPALYRMENKGWVKAEWRLTENNRRARYYRLTPAGRRQLIEETAAWEAFVQTMHKVLLAVPEGA